MQINLDLLLAWGANTKKYDKNDLIFEADQDPRYYFQLVEGKIKMLNIDQEGKEFIQGFFSEGSSFGEPPLFINKKYPASAMAVRSSIIVRIPKERFLTILDEYPPIKQQFLEVFAQRLYQKACTSRNLATNSPEERIICFLNDYKENQKINSPVLIPFTRQEIADLIGLRIETVIRTLSKLNKAKMVQIIDKKLYY